MTNLRAEDIEILEDGVLQTLRSFQYRSGYEEPALLLLEVLIAFCASTYANCRQLFAQIANTMVFF